LCRTAGIGGGKAAQAAAVDLRQLQQTVATDETVLSGSLQLLPSSGVNSESRDQGSAEADYLGVPVTDSRPVTPVDDVDDEILNFGEQATRRASLPGDASTEVSPSIGVGGGTTRTAALAETPAPPQWPPAVKLLLRSDFFSLVQYNDVSACLRISKCNLMDFVHACRVYCHWNRKIEKAGYVRRLHLSTYTSLLY